MSKKTILVIASIAISVLIIAVGFYIIPFKGEKFDVSKFNGDVVSVEGKIITLNGVFGGSSGIIPQDLLSNERDFSFQVNETTRFEELEIDWPTWEEVRAAPGGHLPFKVSDLPQSRKERTFSSFNDTHLLNPGMVYVEADFSDSIYNSKNPVASFIFYRTMNMPPSSPPTQTP